MPTKNDNPIDLADPDFLVGDRTAAYTELRRTSPVARIDMGGEIAYLVSRHEDVRNLARRPETRVNPEGITAPPWLDNGPGRDRLRANLAQTDAPIHTRLRGVLAGQFLPRRVEQLRSVSAQSVADALAALPRDREFDVVQELALRVPRGVICHLLGIPEDDWGRLTEVQHEFLLIFSPFPLSPDEKLALDTVSRFYLDYFEEFLRSRPAEQHTPFVQSLLAAEDRGDLGRVEVLSLMHTVLDAGFETTRTSISNAVELLVTVPGLFDRLRADPDGIRNGVEELLRFRPPIHVRERYLIEEFDASDGSTIPPGAHVFMMLGAANRDESTFEEPDAIDLGRGNAASHLAFGGGLHHCLGAPVARIQLQETLKGLATTFSSLTAGSADHRRHPSLVFPSLISLPVVASAR